MYCPKCGDKNQDSSVFCIKCGSRIIEENIKISNNLELNTTTEKTNNLKFETDDIKISNNGNCNTKAEIKKGSSVKIGENYESTLRAYIGKNSDYYITQFKNIEKNSKANVNWTWLISGLWLLYRRMYAYFFLTLIPIANIYFLINLIFNSNKIYYKFICKKIEKCGMTDTDIENQQDSISLAKKYGGTSYIGIAIFLAIGILVPIVLFGSIMAYISSLNNDDYLYNFNDFEDTEYNQSVKDSLKDKISTFKTGEFYGMVFINEWSNLKFEFPKDFKISTEDEIKELVKQGNAVLFSDSEKLEKAMNKVEELKLAYDFLVTNNDSTLSIQLSYENLNMSLGGTKLNEKGYLDIALKPLFEDKSLGYELLKEEKVNIAEKEFYKYSMSGYNGLIMQDMYCHKIEDRMIVFAVAYVPSLEDKVAEIISKISSARNNSSINIMYKETSITNVLRLSIDDIDAWLGNRTYDDFYNGGRAYGYGNEIIFIFDEDTREIISIIASPKILSVDGQTLDKNQVKLSEVLGTAVDEAWSENDMEEDHYYMYYNFGDYSINFSLPTANEDAYKAYIDIN